MNRKCKNDPNKFCYICGKVTMPDRQSNITRFVRKSYHAYFGMKLGDQDKAFAPHICCKTCVESLRRWSHKKIECLPFGIPMVWREGRDHTNDCYFCMTNLQGINRKNKQHLKYPDVPSAIKPVPHGPGIPIPAPPENCKHSASDSNEQMEDGDISGTYQPTGETSQPKLFSQAELNDLTRDLCLSKESAQLLGSRLRENRLLAPETTFSWYRSREEEFREYFSSDDEVSLVYCSNITGLIAAMGLAYDPTEWRLFIDSSSRSLKAVLLFNGNKIASVPVGHSVQMTENYSNMEGAFANCFEVQRSQLDDLRRPKGCVHGAGSTRRLHQIPLLSLSVGQPSRQAALCTTQLARKIWPGTRFPQRCVTCSCESSEDSTSATAHQARTYEEFCQSTEQRRSSFRFPEQEISSRK
uniref:uncharacterized protein n=1 Tax=Myxine glutinosa TaxID=7769 RepID=UPI0035902CB4